MTEFLLQAENYLAQLEAQIIQLEEESASKVRVLPPSLPPRARSLAPPTELTLLDLTGR